MNTAFRPPAPEPREARPNLLSLLWLLVNNPLEVWTKAHFEEPIVRDGLPFLPAIVVNDPESVRHVLLDNAANYRKDDLLLRILNPGLGEGLLTVEGQQWRKQRHAVAPMFSRRTIYGFANAMKEAIFELTARWSRLGDGAIVDVAKESGRLTLDVLRRTIISEGFDQDNDAILLAMRCYFDSIGRIDPMDALGVPDFVPRPTRGPERDALRFFKTTVASIISKRRSLQDNGDGPRDLLALLLDASRAEGLTEEEIQANVLTFIAAGHETTANAITWSLFLLGQDPQWRERVANEADGTDSSSEDPCAHLPLSKAVLEESLRLYPPIAAISRVAIDEDVIAGEVVQPGTMVIVAPYLLHRHRRLWREPDMFVPDRFLEPDRPHVNRFSYLPFGAGPRTCIGAAFALQEATLALSTIARTFRWRLAPDVDVQPLLRITLRPKDGLRMQITRRSHGHTRLDKSLA